MIGMKKCRHGGGGVKSSKKGAGVLYAQFYGK